jgi:hypothetical protein
MEEKNNDNIYQNLKGLIWSAFIGIVSFQILAPNIWGYLHKLLGIGYQTAYWEFIIGYILIVPALAVFWLMKDYRIIIRYLPPVDDPVLSAAESKKFLNRLILYIILEFIVTGLLLCLRISYSALFVFWVVVNAAACVYLFVCGASITYDSLIKERENISAIINRKKFWQLFSICILSFIFLACIGITYLLNNNNKSLYKNDDRQAGRLGFQLLTLRENIDSSARNMRDLADSLKLLNIREGLYQITNAAIKMSHEDSAAVDSCKDELVYPLRALTAYGDSTLKILSEIKNRTPLSDLEKNIRHWQPGGEALIHYDLTIKNMIGTYTKEHWKWTNAILQEYTNYLFQYISSLEKQIDNTARDQLGKLLRDTQTKCMFMFMGLFTALLALHIFLKIHGDVLLQQSADLAEEKRLLFANHTRITDDSQLELQIIQQENKVSESNRLAGNSWLFITLTVWLLIPFFKPVEDDKIDTDAPFKMLTAAGSAGDILNPGKESPRPAPVPYFLKDTGSTYNIKIDTILFVSQGKSDKTNMTKELEDRIKSIGALKDTIHKMNEILIEIKRKVDHIEHNKKSP